MIFSLSGMARLVLAFGIRFFARGAVRSRAGLGLRYLHRAVVDARGAVAGIVGERVLEIVCVVALLETVEALVRAARFLAVDRRIHDRLRDVEQIAELDREQPFGVPRSRVIVN